jgi:hypothetical protein
MDVGPAYTVIRYTVGQTGTLWDPAYSVPFATIKVSAPTFATSDSGGDTPQYGYFATFNVTMTDIAPAATQDELVPDSDDFYVQFADGNIYGNGDQTGVLGGNGFWAELDNDLGNAPDLLPGQSASGTVTIDVPGLHGEIVYNGGDDGKVDGSWSY